MGGMPDDVSSILAAWPYSGTIIVFTWVMRSHGLRLFIAPRHIFCIGDHLDFLGWRTVKYRRFKRLACMKTGFS